MAEWIETYRGVVSAWECDIVEHFTIACYFERFANATRNFLELIGEGETLGPAAGTGTSRLYTTFTQELRAGAGGRVQPSELGAGGTMSLAGQVHRFSRAGLQFLSS